MSFLYVGILYVATTRHQPCVGTVSTSSRNNRMFYLLTYYIIQRTNLSSFQPASHSWTLEAFFYHIFKSFQMDLGDCYLNCQRPESQDTDSWIALYKSTSMIFFSQIRAIWYMPTYPTGNLLHLYSLWSSWIIQGVLVFMCPRLTRSLQ